MTGDVFDRALDEYLARQDEAEHLLNEALDDLTEAGVTDPTEEQLEAQMEIVEQRWVDQQEAADEARAESLWEERTGRRHGYF